MTLNSLIVAGIVFIQLDKFKCFKLGRFFKFILSVISLMALMKYLTCLKIFGNVLRLYFVIYNSLTKYDKTYLFM